MIRKVEGNTITLAGKCELNAGDTLFFRRPSLWERIKEWWRRSIAQPLPDDLDESNSSTRQRLQDEVMREAIARKAREAADVLQGTF